MYHYERDFAILPKYRPSVESYDGVSIRDVRPYIRCGAAPNRKVTSIRPDHHKPGYYDSTVHNPPDTWPWETIQPVEIPWDSN